MSSILSEKLSCSVTCNSSSNTFCDGCGKSYCKRHSIKHQDRLIKQMEKVYLYHDQLQKLLFDDTKRISNHSLMKQIDDWEQQSINKIQQTAKEIRHQFKLAFTKYTIDMHETFRQISEQINKARLENNCIENDMKIWLEKFMELKKDYRTPKTINIRQDDYAHAFINKISIHHISIDTFHQSIGDIHSDDDIHKILHGPTSGDATIRGKQELFSGRYQFRFHIYQLGIPKWVFFGIISKNTALQSSLYKTPTVYGWAGHHQVWLNGNHHHQYDGFKCEMANQHIIELLIDCDQNKIQLTNETLAMTHEIDVSIIKCPFPWVLYIGLYGANDEIRLQLA
ncbi:hypothetical protein I4U23_019839 [Adineta vaga]|nr:hypothetical protein I4U23_019839 [Adineta vaga]